MNFQDIIKSDLRMLVSDYIIDFLASVGIKHIFGYQGGSVTHLIDSVARNPNINYIQNYHEQASALCADDNCPNLNWR